MASPNHRKLSLSFHNESPSPLKGQQVGRHGYRHCKLRQDSTHDNPEQPRTRQAKSRQLAAPKELLLATKRSWQQEGGRILLTALRWLGPCLLQGTCASTAQHGSRHSHAVAPFGAAPVIHAIHALLSESYAVVHELTTPGGAFKRYRHVNTTNPEGSVWALATPSHF